MPAALTTMSVLMGPLSVSTPVTRPFACVNPVTVTPSTIRAPRIRAPFA
jgi:hypothetical protein